MFHFITAYPTCVILSWDELVPKLLNFRPLFHSPSQVFWEKSESAHRLLKSHPFIRWLFRTGPILPTPRIITPNNQPEAPPRYSEFTIDEIYFCFSDMSTQIDGMPITKFQRRNIAFWHFYRGICWSRYYWNEKLNFFFNLAASSCKLVFRIYRCVEHDNWSVREISIALTDFFRAWSHCDQRCFWGTEYFSSCLWSNTYLGLSEIQIWYEDQSFDLSSLGC